MALNTHTIRVALIVSLGGFLMGFDASVISGVVGFIEVEFNLTKVQLGWSVSSLALTATLGMMLSGPLSDRIGRRPLLLIAAIVFAVSAIASAMATSFAMLVAARMLGGLGVGAALIIAPMYIAEISPAKSRGRMVSFNQLNIVIGISAAFFSNYLLITLADADVALVDALRLSDWQWRWMLGVEAVPAIIYFLALSLVPESPRWLVMKGRDDEALNVLEGVAGKLGAASRLSEIRDSLVADADIDNPSIASLLHPSLRLVLTIGISIGILQQITGINSVFFYAPMIFEQSGIGTSAAFMQAVLVGLVNLVFTIAALFLIDRLGRRPLLTWGMTGIAVCMLTLAYGFGTATYRLDGDALDRLPSSIDQQQIATLEGIRYESDREFRQAVYSAIGQDEYTLHESLLIGSAITINPVLILAGILGFVASFAISIGPIMWVLFSELFPNRIRGLAISFVGLINSIVAFLVTLVFPWQLENIGTSATFMIYGLFAMVGVVIVVRILPETKNRSLEELEGILVRT